MQINEEQYNLIEEEFGKLIHHISRRITGDCAIATPEDNHAELWGVVVKTVETFARLNPQYKTFEDFWETAHWIKYLKSSLWNYKNKKGNYLKKRYGLNSSSVNLDEDYTKADDKIRGSYNMYMESLMKKCGKMSKEDLNTICNNPDRIEDCMDIIDDCLGDG